MDTNALRLLIFHLENNVVYDENGIARVTKEVMQVIVNALKSSRSLKCCLTCTNNDCRYRGRK